MRRRKRNRNPRSCTLFCCILLKVIWVRRDWLGRLLPRCLVVRTPHGQEIGMRTRKHVVAHECEALVAEPIANDLAAVVLDERTEIVRVDDLHFDALRLNDAAPEPAPIDPLAHLVTANVQRLGQQRYREPFPALSDTESQPMQHGPNGCRGPAEDSRRLFDGNVINQFDQTLLLTCGPLAITALFGQAKATQETQARTPRIP